MKQYRVYYETICRDAFTDMLFHGNQAVVCDLDEWAPDKLMMDNTMENNFSDTAFTVRR